MIVNIMKNALKWGEPLLRDFLKYNSDNQKEFIQYIFKRYKDFETELYTIFKDSNEKRTAGCKLAKFRQIGSISVYAAQF